MTKGYFLRTKSVIRPSQLRNFADLSRRRVGQGPTQVLLGHRLAVTEKNIFFLCSVGFVIRLKRVSAFSFCYFLSAATEFCD